jgi:hypothetical protein
VRIRLYRPVAARRARSLLALALLLPAAGFLSAAGPNPVTIATSAAFAALAVVTFYSALRPIAVVVRSGLLITGAFGQPNHALSWGEIVRVERDDDVVGIATSNEKLYQLQLDPRAALLLSRMIERHIVAGARLEE